MQQQKKTKNKKQKQKKQVRKYRSPTSFYSDMHTNLNK